MNVFRSFKAHTTFSESGVLNHGNEIGYALDTASSWGFDDGNNLSGRGVFDNEYAPPTSVHALTTNWDLGSHNDGKHQLLRKQLVVFFTNHDVYPRALIPSCGKYMQNFVLMI